MGAWRVLRGQVPYRDFFAIETPLSFYILAPMYAFFGVSLAVGRIVAQVLGAALVVLTLRLARRSIPSPLFAAVPVAFLCQAGVGLLPFANHHWFADVFCMAALLCAHRAWRDSWTPGWWLAGVGAALAFLSLQDQGLWMLVGLGVVAGIAPSAPPRRNLARFGGGALLALLPISLMVLSRSRIGPAWHDLVVFPLTAYRDSPGNAYGFLQPFEELRAQWTSGVWRHAPLFTGAATITSLALILSLLSSPFLLIWSFKRRKAPSVDVAVLLTGVTVFMLTAFHRWAPINVQWAAAPPAIAAGFVLHHEASASARGRRWSSAVACILLAAFVVFGIGRIAQAMDERIWVDVRSPAGVTRVPGQTTGRRIQEMLDEVGRRVPPGDPLLVYGWPNWAFATLHLCPVRWDGFAPPYFPPGRYVHGAVSEVEEKRVPWIVTPAFDPPAPGEHDEWKDYLTSRYRLEWANEGWGLWKRGG